MDMIHTPITNKQKKTRGFEVVSKSQLKPMSAHFEYIKTPQRSDVGSAGYDFQACEDVRLEAGQQHLFWTNIKAYMQEDEVLYLFPRSSVGVKQGLMLANTVGVIDSTYYNNKQNEGNIGIVLKNMSNSPVIIEAGDRIAQGVFMKYLSADEDVVVNTERTGGFGSTGR